MIVGNSVGLLLFPAWVTKMLRSRTGERTGPVGMTSESARVGEIPRLGRRWRPSVWFFVKESFSGAGPGVYSISTHS